MSARRLSEGGRIDREQSISFNWDGKRLQGFAGDTLASALIANNEQVLARSFKYHRPRGIMSAGVEESGALVTIGSGDRRDPNVKATAGSKHSVKMPGPTCAPMPVPSTVCSGVFSLLVSTTKRLWACHLLNGARVPVCG